ncbi:MAG: hypothetical protein ATN32_03215 [Candidatus Epulonipiscium fishelsonii]|nr:MAG: hypothetical protein ATN32_03215 [Epulopiscium sp. AS2M-Bin002]
MDASKPSKELSQQDEINGYVEKLNINKIYEIPNTAVTNWSKKLWLTRQIENELDIVHNIKDISVNIEKIEGTSNYQIVLKKGNVISKAVILENVTEEPLAPQALITPDSFLHGAKSFNIYYKGHNTAWYDKYKGNDEVTAILENKNKRIPIEIDLNEDGMFTITPLNPRDLTQGNYTLRIYCETKLIDSCNVKVVNPSDHLSQAKKIVETIKFINRSVGEIPAIHTTLASQTKYVYDIISNILINEGNNTKVVSVLSEEVNGKPNFEVTLRNDKVATAYDITTMIEAEFEKTMPPIINSFSLNLDKENVTCLEVPYVYFNPESTAAQGWEADNKDAEIETKIKYTGNSAEFQALIKAKISTDDYIDANGNNVNGKYIINLNTDLNTGVYTVTIGDSIIEINVTSPEETTTEETVIEETVIEEVVTEETATEETATEETTTEETTTEEVVTEEVVTEEIATEEIATEETVTEETAVEEVENEKIPAEVISIITEIEEMLGIEFDEIVVSEEAPTDEDFVLFEVSDEEDIEKESTGVAIVEVTIEEVTEVPLVELTPEENEAETQIGEMMIIKVLHREETTEVEETPVELAVETSKEEVLPEPVSGIVEEVIQEVEEIIGEIINIEETYAETTAEIIEEKVEEVIQNVEEVVEVIVNIEETPAKELVEEIIQNVEEVIVNIEETPAEELVEEIIQYIEETPTNEAPTEEIVEEDIEEIIEKQPTKIIKEEVEETPEPEEEETGFEAFKTKVSNFFKNLFK